MDHIFVSVFIDMIECWNVIYGGFISLDQKESLTI